jgi:hypothetical protein
MAPTAAQFVAVARSQIGYRESAGNRTKYGAWYGMNGTAWCAIFMSWCAWKAGATKIIPRHAYTPAGADWFKARGQWHTSKPKVGDLVYFNFPGDGVNRISHVGTVEAVKADGSIITIEGNTNAAGSRTGGGVWRKARRTGIVGYGRPKYAVPATTRKITPLAASTKVGKVGWQVSDLRYCLAKAGYLAKSAATSNDKYDAAVSKAVERFHNANPKFKGGDNRQIGPQGWKALQYKIGRR